MCTYVTTTTPVAGSGYRAKRLAEAIIGILDHEEVRPLT